MCVSLTLINQNRVLYYFLFRIYLLSFAVLSLLIHLWHTLYSTLQKGRLKLWLSFLLYCFAFLFLFFSLPFYICVTLFFALRLLNINRRLFFAFYLLRLQKIANAALYKFFSSRNLRNKCVVLGSMANYRHYTCICGDQGGCLRVEIKIQCSEILPVVYQLLQVLR